MAENGLDYPGVGTEVRQFITEGVAAAMQGQTRRNASIPLQPQHKGMKRLPKTSLCQGASIGTSDDCWSDPLGFV